MRFIVISDTHYYVNDHGKNSVFWNMPLSFLQHQISKDMLGCIEEAKPDFVIHCGDLVDRCHPENYDFSWDIVRKMNCPFYLAVGNHDTMDKAARIEISDFYGLPKGQCYYSKVIGGVCFIFLDSCYYLTASGETLQYRNHALYSAGQIKGLLIPDHEIEWLSSELNAHSDKNIIIVSHAPLSFKDTYPVKTLPKGAKGKTEGTSAAEFTEALGIGLYNRQKAHDVIKRHANVKMVLSGHWHINDYHTQDGIVFCQTASMREYPFEYRLVQIDNDRLFLSTKALNDKSFAAQSFIKENGNEWVRGHGQSREFTMDFNKG